MLRFPERVLTPTRATFLGHHPERPDSPRISAWHRTPPGGTPRRRCSATRVRRLGNSRFLGKLVPPNLIIRAHLEVLIPERVKSETIKDKFRRKTRA